jgi:hypothetical protein
MLHGFLPVAPPLAELHPLCSVHVSPSIREANTHEAMNERGCEALLADAGEVGGDGG